MECFGPEGKKSYFLYTPGGSFSEGYCINRPAEKAELASLLIALPIALRRWASFYAKAQLSTSVGYVHFQRIRGDDRSRLNAELNVLWRVGDRSWDWFEYYT